MFCTMENQYRAKIQGNGTGELNGWYVLLGSSRTEDDLASSSNPRFCAVRLLVGSGGLL